MTGGRVWTLLPPEEEMTSPYFPLKVRRILYSEEFFQPENVFVLPQHNWCGADGE